MFALVFVGSNRGAIERAPRGPVAGSRGEEFLFRLVKTPSREGDRAMIKLVLIRHGQSTWNLENRFTGWTDVDLSELGRQEALAGAKLLRDEGFTFDVAYTSVLKRAIKTLWIVLETLELEWIPVTRAWQLNERHYG